VPALEHEAYNILFKMPEIIELHPLFGGYGPITKIEAEDFEKIGEIVINKIRSIEGVIDTKTLIGPKFLNLVHRSEAD